jgi:hypothetical protein
MSYPLASDDEFNCDVRMIASSSESSSLVVAVLLHLEGEGRRNSEMTSV